VLRGCCVKVDSVPADSQRLGLELLAKGPSSNLVASSGVPASRPQSLSTPLVVDYDGADQHIVEEPAAIIEKCGQEDKRRQERYRDPVNDRMRGTQHKVCGCSVPGAHLDIHEPHAERGGGGPGKREAVVQDGPNDGCG